MGDDRLETSGKGAFAACQNEVHEGRQGGAPLARWHVEWPDGAFDGTTACLGCATWLLRLARDHGAAVLFRPVASSSLAAPS